MTVNHETPPDKPRLRDRLRSRYSGQPAPPRSAKVIVEQGVGRIIGYELPDGTLVKVKPCCDNPVACEKDECWGPGPRKPWWSGP